MPTQEMLVMAVTHMRTGVCIAGFLRDPHEHSVLRWVRPVKQFGTVLLGDICDAAGRAMACGDVVEINLLQPCLTPPHCEDQTADWIRHRPRLLRRLEGERRSRFFASHLDRRPEDILEDGARSLCLVKPNNVWARFELDAYSLKYQARLGFSLEGVHHVGASSQKGVAVTDIKWRALGRHWLGAAGGTLSLKHDELLERLKTQQIYLALGLGRARADDGRHWPLVIGVHAVPDYVVEIDYDRL